MLINNNARWNIWHNTGKTLDYNVFAQACIDSDTEPLTYLDFAHRVGMILVGMTTYPELEPVEAYKTTAELTKFMVDKYAPAMEQQGITPSTSCCGGGKVR